MTLSLIISRERGIVESNFYLCHKSKTVDKIGEHREDSSDLYLYHKNETVDSIGEQRQDCSDLYLCHKSETVAAMYYVYLVS